MDTNTIPNSVYPPSQRAAAAEADLRYWRESVQYAVELLARGRLAGRDHSAAAIDAENYLRQLLELDEVGQCYDCRTDEQRLVAIEAEQRVASRTLHASLNEIERRLEVIEDRLDALNGSDCCLGAFAGIDIGGGA